MAPKVDWPEHKNVLFMPPPPPPLSLLSGLKKWTTIEDSKEPVSDEPDRRVSVFKTASR